MSVNCFTLLGHGGSCLAYEKASNIMEEVRRKKRGWSKTILSSCRNIGTRTQDLFNVTEAL